MIPRPEKWFVTLGRTFRNHAEETAGEPLPKRWKDLILLLDEQERQAPSTAQSAAFDEREDWWRAGD